MQVQTAVHSHRPKEPVLGHFSANLWAYQGGAAGAKRNEFMHRCTKGAPA